MQESAASDVRSVEISKADSVRATRAFPKTLQDIPITYVNNTGIDDPEFSVVVFTNNQNPSSTNFQQMAWKARNIMHFHALISAVWSFEC